MTLSEILDGMARAGKMDPALAERLKGMEEGRPFSVHREIRGLLYLGTILVAVGLGATVKEYFDQLGPWTVLGGLLAVFLAALVYCFKRGERFDREAVTAPTLAFDYILYLGCVAWGLAAAYGENHFHIFGAAWKAHFFISSALFIVLAYRFDNRLVLSLGLSSLAAWFGLELNNIYASFTESHRTFGLVFGTLSALAAYGTLRLDLKRHFQDVYGNFAGHFILAALLSGTVQNGFWSLYFLGLAAGCALAAAYAVRSRKFFYMVYAALYGYAGVSYVLMHSVREEGFIFLYLIVSSLTVGSGLYYLARRFREEV